MLGSWLPNTVLAGGIVVSIFLVAVAFAASGQGRATDALAFGYWVPLSSGGAGISVVLITMAAAVVSGVVPKGPIALDASALYRVRHHGLLGRPF